jgi:hypothetical protein
VTGAHRTALEGQISRNGQYEHDKRSGFGV